MADWTDQISGGLADLKDPSNFDPKQLQIGVKVEMEHTSDPKKATEIAMDHLIEDPKYYQKLKKVENKTMIPKLTEVFKVNEANYYDVEEAWPQDDLDLGDTKGRKPGMSVADKMKAKGQEKRLGAASKRRQDKSVKAGNLARPQQQSLPGMDKVFGQKPAPKPGQWPAVQDDRLPLDQAKGKYLHISQSSDVTPYWLQQTGHTYETIPSNLMKGLKVDTNPGAAWGSGTYKIGDDGVLTLAAADWDSSG